MRRRKQDVKVKCSYCKKRQAVGAGTLKGEKPYCRDKRCRDKAWKLYWSIMRETTSEWQNSMRKLGN